MRLTLNGAVSIAVFGLAGTAVAGQAAPQVQLHGVVSHVDVAKRSFGISQLSGLESYWSQSADHILADGSIDMAAINSGQHVTVLLSKGTNGIYYARHVAVN